MTIPVDAMRRLFDFPELLNLGPRYNIAPTQQIAVVRGAGPRHLVMLRWGLVPGWATDLNFGARTINARAETVADKPAFRSAFARRRCLVPADAFYEWRTENKIKQPYLIRLAGGQPFAFAGLWESWSPPDGGEPIETCAIITTTAAPAIAHIHPRMPVILPEAAYGTWLDEGCGREDLLDLLHPWSEDNLTSFSVSRRVSSVAHDDAECQAPLAAPQPQAPVQGSLF